MPDGEKKPWDGIERRKTDSRIRDLEEDMRAGRQSRKMMHTQIAELKTEQKEGFTVIHGRFDVLRDDLKEYIKKAEDNNIALAVVKSEIKNNEAEIIDLKENQRWAVKSALAGAAAAVSSFCIVVYKTFLGK